MRLGRSPVVDGVRSILAKVPGTVLEDSPEYYDIGVFNRCVAEGVLLLSLDYWKDVHPSIVSVPLKVNASHAYGVIYAADAPAEVLKFISIAEEQARRG